MVIRSAEERQVRGAESKKADNSAYTIETPILTGISENFLQRD